MSMPPKCLTLVVLMSTIAMGVIGTLYGLITFPNDYLPSAKRGRRDIQQMRLQKMQENCAQLNDSWQEPTWNAFYVLHQKRTVMCLVAKTSGTTWLRVLLRLTGIPAAVKLASAPRSTLHRHVGKYIGRMFEIHPSTRARYLMGHYYKAMFVREPLERLISGYRDKMNPTLSGYESLQENVKRMFRRNFREHSTKLKQKVTFSEFVRYVLWERTHKQQVELHWRPQYDLCRPCHIKYDYIGYYHTIHDDAKDILRIIATDSDVHYPAADFDRHGPNSKNYLKLYENVSVSNIRHILNFYENDYKVFGFKIPDVIRRGLHHRSE